MMLESDVVAAQHVGPCAAKACKDMIRPGEAMQKADGRWFHEECVPVEHFPDDSPHPDQLGLDDQVAAVDAGEDDAGEAWDRDWRNK